MSPSQNSRIHRIARPLVVAVLLMGAMPRICRAWSSSELLTYFGYGGDDHAKLTTGALIDVGSDYPDLAMYQSQIVTGVGQEGFGILTSPIGAHKSPDNSTLYWSGNQDLWRQDIKLVQYRQFTFADAYMRLGYLVHLDQDIQVPAHIKVVRHGPPATYTVSPTDTSQFSIGVSQVQRDNLELFASNNHVDTGSDGINFDQAFLDPATGCNEKFWLGPTETGNAPLINIGAYGRQSGIPCTSPFLKPTSDAGQDWFDDTNFASVLTPLAQRISNAQLTTARSVTAAELETISQSLPPLVRIPLKISDPVVNSNTGTTITFKAIENRMPDLAVKLYVKENNQAIVDAAGLTWDGSWKDALGSDVELPWGKLYSIVWNGNVSGTQLVDGNYNLCIQLTDHDGNIFPDPTQGDQPQCENFNREGPSFLVGAQLRAVREGESFGGLKVRKERRAYRQAGSLC